MLLARDVLVKLLISEGHLNERAETLADILLAKFHIKEKILIPTATAVFKLHITESIDPQVMIEDLVLLISQIPLLTSEKLGDLAINLGADILSLDFNQPALDFACCLVTSVFHPIMFNPREKMKLLITYLEQQYKHDYVTILRLAGYKRAIKPDYEE